MLGFDQSATSSIRELLAKPRRSGVTERVRRDVLLDAGALHRSRDDVGEDRPLQSATGEPARDRVAGLRRARVAQHPEFVREASRPLDARQPPACAAVPARRQGLDDHADRRRRRQEFNPPAGCNAPQPPAAPPAYRNGDKVWTMTPPTVPQTTTTVTCNAPGDAAKLLVQLEKEGSPVTSVQCR